MNDLKQRTIRGGFVKLCGQAVSLLLRVGFMVTLARLLDPKDFGLVAMVTVVTGVYALFTSAGLSTATVQKASVTDEQISTLFWINVLVGSILTVLCLASAPVLVTFYGEPRLFWVTVALAAGFMLSAAGVQHLALLQRQLRYTTLTVIDALSQVTSSAIGVGMAVAGFGYWSLVAAAIVTPAITTLSAWVAVGWIPGKPRRDAEIRSMLHFGGTFTLNCVVVYAAYNFEKVLLGRFWGADALGIYGRAYQLISFPTDYLNGAIGGVAFSALSRLQNDPVRLRSYFLKGYTLTVSMTLPVTLCCALFADEIIQIVLGPNWADAAEIFRLLTPTVLIFAMINPTAWLLLSVGLQGRSLKLAFVIAPLVITAYLIGLPYGPRGVAFAYSTAMTLWVIPHILWCLYGTVISPVELFRAIGRPFLSGAVAAVFALGTQLWIGPSLGPLPRLLLGGSVMLAVYVWMLLFVLGQREIYLGLLNELRRRPAG
jgi:PST family polysaccharide transporter